MQRFLKGIALFLLFTIFVPSVFFIVPANSVFADEGDDYESESWPEDEDIDYDQESDLEIGTFEVTYDAATKEAFVERLYSIVLNREVDSDGLNYWLSELNGNATGASVAYGFIFSREFKDRSLTKRGFTKVLYQVFFDRTPSTEEVEYWYDRLSNGSTRQQVFTEFVNSNEFNVFCKNSGILAGCHIYGCDRGRLAYICHFVDTFYTRTLKRSASNDEMLYWATNLYNRSMTGIDFSYSILFSEEHRNEFADSYAGTYVGSLYYALLGRKATSNDAFITDSNSWSTAYMNGATDLDVLNAIISSPEFAYRCEGCGIEVGTPINPATAPYVFSRKNAKIAHVTFSNIVIDTSTGVQPLLTMFVEGDAVEFGYSYVDSRSKHYNKHEVPRNFTYVSPGHYIYDYSANLGRPAGDHFTLAQGNVDFELYYDGFVIYEETFVVSY